MVLGYAYIDLLAKGSISINQKQFAEQVYIVQWTVNPQGHRSKAKPYEWLFRNNYLE